MIRYTLLTLFVSGLAIYAWKDWYKSLCGLILLMAVVEHPDFPKSMFGIQGFNPWNLLLGIIILAWLFSRKRERLYWDFPGYLTLIVLLYVALIIISFFRMYSDIEPIIRYAILVGNDPPTKSGILSEYLINSIKWIIPAFLLYDGCRSRERLYWAIFSILGVYFFLGLQVIKWMPLSAAISGEALSERSAKIIVNEIGYHRVNMAVMLAGAFWAILSMVEFTSKKFQKIIILLISGVVGLALALTAGRTGYATWAILGILLGIFRWKKLLLAIPAFATLVVWLVPGAYERLTHGFDPNERDINVRVQEHIQEVPLLQESDTVWTLYTITSGRNIAWPFEIEKIKEAPLFGYGRLAMQRTGLSEFLWVKLGESFPHPHNAYLQWVLDNGLLGLIPVLLFYGIVLLWSVRLFRSNISRFVVVGGIAFSLVASQLIASIGSQSFYPRESTVGMWCSIALLFRAYITPGYFLEKDSPNHRMEMV